MTVILEFMTGQVYDNDNRLRSLLDTDQPLNESASQTTPTPQTVEVQVTTSSITVSLVGVSLDEATQTSLDAWCNSIESGLPNAVCVDRRDVPEA